MIIHKVFLDNFDNGSDHPDYTEPGIYKILGETRMELIEAMSWTEYMETQPNE